MSLIDEALKRAQEAARKAGGTPEARPWTPAPQPDAGLARRRRVGRMLAWSVAIAVAVILGAVGVRAVWNAAASGERPASPAVPAPTAPAPEPTLAETIVTTPIAAASAAPARPTAKPAPTPAAEGVSIAEAAPGETPAVPPSRPVADGRIYVRTVSLPGGARIELGGIAWSEEEPRALLNDRIVGTGAYLEGFTVAKIAEDRVVLEKDGVSITLTLK